MNKETIRKTLRDNPYYRKISHKNEMLAMLVRDKRMSKDLITDILSADRLVRKVKEEHPELNGPFSMVYFKGFKKIFDI